MYKELINNRKVGTSQVYTQVLTFYPYLENAWVVTNVCRNNTLTLYFETGEELLEYIEEIIK